VHAVIGLLASGRPMGAGLLGATLFWLEGSGAWNYLVRNKFCREAAKF